MPSAVCASANRRSSSSTAVMGAEVSTQRLWRRAAELDLARMIYVNMLDRERADFYRTLESLKAAFGQHVVATEIPVGAEHEIAGVVDLVDMKCYLYPAAGPRQRGRGADSRRPGGRAVGVPGEADGRGRRGLRLADGALPRRSRDLPSGDRRRPQGGHQPRVDLPGRLRRRDPQPRHQPTARRDRRGPAVAGQARPARAAGDHARAGRGRRAVRLRLQDAGRLVRRADQSVPRLPGRHAPGHAAPQHALAHQGTDRSADGLHGQGHVACRRVRSG